MSKQAKFGLSNTVGLRVSSGLEAKLALDGLDSAAAGEMDIEGPGRSKHEDEVRLRCP
jgi:hypothetical protein